MGTRIFYPNRDPLLQVSPEQLSQKADSDNVYTKEQIDAQQQTQDNALLALANNTYTKEEIDGGFDTVFQTITTKETESKSRDDELESQITTLSENINDAVGKVGNKHTPILSLFSRNFVNVLNDVSYFDRPNTLSVLTQSGETIIVDVDVPALTTKGWLWDANTAYYIEKYRSTTASGDNATLILGLDKDDVIALASQNTLPVLGFTANPDVVDFTPSVSIDVIEDSLLIDVYGFGESTTTYQATVLLEDIGDKFLLSASIDHVSQTLEIGLNGTVISTTTLTEETPLIPTDVQYLTVYCGVGDLNYTRLDWFNVAIPEAELPLYTG